VLENSEIISTSEKQTLDLARGLAGSMSLPAHILLYGDLGAGKTLFTKGLAEAFGVDDPDEVSSPTFTLINQYKGRIPVFHIDLYRIDTGRLEGLGLEEIFDYSKAAVIIEWAERLGNFEAPGAVEVFFSYVDEHSRKIKICRSSP
jgi:tRNA threonylcarbamoyladenosine biosynthesis protein TsaE